MKQAETDRALPADPELDAELALMAEEVPPVPADFHHRWMNAVREDKKTGHGISLTGWTRILSVAAAMIFLIGGTVLYRNSKHSLNAFRTERKAAVTAESSGEQAAAGDTDPLAAEMETDSGDGTETETGTLSVMTANTAKEIDAEAYEADMTAAPESMGVFAAEEADSMYETSEEADEASCEETEEIPARVDSLPAALRAEKSGTQAKGSAEETETGFLRDTGAFLSDMGDFLLAALPYLAVLAVPVAVALVIRGKKRKN